MDGMGLTPLSAEFQLYHGGQVTGEGNRSTRRKPPTLQLGVCIHVVHIHTTNITPLN